MTLLGQAAMPHLSHRATRRLPRFEQIESNREAGYYPDRPNHDDERSSRLGDLRPSDVGPVPEAPLVPEQSKR